MQAGTVDRRLSRLSLVLVMLVGLVASGLSPALASHDFADVGDDHPFHDQISWLVAEGIASGYPDGSFRPGAEVSRQAVAAFLYRMAGEPAVDGSSGFSDVVASHPFHDAIAWAASQGVAEGYEDGTFRPDVEVSRQAAATFIFRAVGEPEGTWDSDFSDVADSHPFYRAISWLAAEDISGGFPDGTFRPVVPVTRQAIAAFLQRTVEAGYEVDPGDVEPEFGSVSGTVTDADSSDAIEGATVTVDGESTTTGTDGAYSIDDVAVGTQTVSVTADGYQDGSTSIEVAADETATADFALEAEVVVVPGPASIVLDPVSATVPTDEQHTIVAAVEDDEGAPVADGTLVTFEVDNGDDETVATVDGEAEFSYGIDPVDQDTDRDDTVTVCVVDTEGDGCGDADLVETATVTWQVRSGTGELVVSQEFDALFVDQTKTVTAAFVDQFGDPVVPDEPTDITFDVHRFGALEVDGAAPLTERVHRGSLTESVTTDGDGVATFTYHPDGDPDRFSAPLGGLPQDLSTHPTMDGADRDHIVACTDPVEGVCSTVDEGAETEKAEVTVLDAGDTDRVVNQWVLSDVTTGVGQEILGGGVLMGVFHYDVVSDEDGRFGAVSDRAARGEPWGLVQYRFNVRTALVQVAAGEVFTSSPILEDGFTLRAGALGEGPGREILQLEDPTPMPVPVSTYVGPMSELQQGVDAYGYTFGPPGTGVQDTYWGMVQDPLAVRDLGELGGSLLVWAEESGLVEMMANPELADPMSVVPPPSLDFSLDVATEDNPQGEVRAQVPMGGSKSDMVTAQRLLFPNLGHDTPPVFRYVESAEETSVSSGQDIGLRFDQPVANRYTDAFGPRALTGDDFTVTVNGDPVEVVLGGQSLAEWATYRDYHTISIDRELEFGDEFTVEISPEAAELIVTDDTIEVMDAMTMQPTDMPQPVRTLDSVLSRSWTVGGGQARVTGTVTDVLTGIRPLYQYAPVPVTVTLWSTDGAGEPEEQVASTVTDTGEYTLHADATAEGESYTLTVEQDRFRTAVVEDITLEERQIEVVDVGLELADGTVQGRVYDVSTGNQSTADGVAGVTVTAVEVDGDGPVDGGHSDSAVTQADGSYAIEVPAGTYQLTADAAGYTAGNATVTFGRNTPLAETRNIGLTPDGWDPAVPDHLGFLGSQVPRDATAGNPMSRVTVEVYNSAGSRVGLGEDASVRLVSPTPTSGPTEASLTSTGRAAFDGLVFTEAGTHELVFELVDDEYGGLTVTSDPITIHPDDLSLDESSVESSDEGNHRLVTFTLRDQYGNAIEATAADIEASVPTGAPFAPLPDLFAFESFTDLGGGVYTVEWHGSPTTDGALRFGSSILAVGVDLAYGEEPAV